MRNRRQWFCLMILLTVIGCGGNKDQYVSLWWPNNTLVNASYIIADKLSQDLEINLSPDQPILVASFVDVNNIEQSSSFGRMMAEYICSRLGQSGHTVVEMKLRDSIFIKEKAGEFLLSRNIKDIYAAYSAQAVVVGTYARTKKEVLVSAKLVQADNSKILASCDLKMRLSRSLMDMFDF
ncbi:FlgO family outer membrane protein [Thermodesulfobacteriota bacterium]